jgi:hypothetical protein
MLRRFLSALLASPTATGLEIRLRLGLSREQYADQLSHLIRLGYVTAAETAEASCPSGGCQGCPIGCQSSPALGPQTLAVTEKGRRFAGSVAS